MLNCSHPTTPHCRLGDIGVIRIFLNTHGTDEENINPELKEMLYFMEHSTYDKKVHWGFFMKRNRNYELIAHHSMATVGGFFGVYALLNRSETFGSSTTANLIYIFAAGLSHSPKEFFVRMIALCLYAAGIILATLLTRASKNADCRYASVAIDIACCIILAQIPAAVHPVLALYPMFFATAFQWIAYSKVGDFQSSSIFSTNNMRQSLAGLTNYLCDRNPKELQRVFVFGTTMLCFHAGVVYGWFCMQAWSLKSIYACIPLALLGGVVTWLDCRQMRN